MRMARVQPRDQRASHAGPPSPKRSRHGVVCCSLELLRLRLDFNDFYVRGGAPAAGGDGDDLDDDEA
jgi:hypothetical protein